MNKNGLLSKPDDGQYHQMAERLPQSLRPFFWDVDIGNISIVESARFIIGRLMEHGDENAVRFLLKTYRQDQLIDALKMSRAVSRRSRTFWQVFLEMDENSCPPKRYPTPYGN